MKLLVDTDAFCKLGLAGLLPDAALIFGAKLEDCRRLPALPYMLRRGRLRKRYGGEDCDRLIPLADGMPAVPEASVDWLDKLVSFEGVDPGEAQMIAVAAEFGVFVLSGDKRAFTAIKTIDSIRNALAGRICVLEAALLALCERLGTQVVKQRVAPLADKDQVIKTCFSPSNPSPVEGLQSVLQERRRRCSAAPPLAASSRWQLVTFGAHHYVPILKIKRGEKRALAQIAANVHQKITPLLEIVERKADKAPTIQRHLDTSFKGLAESVSLYSRCFLDVREIASDGPQAAIDVFRRASDAGMVFTPVTGISRTVDVAAALGHRTHGLALRLMRSEFENGDLATRVDSFLRLHGLMPHELDLVVDLGAIEELIVDGVVALTEAFIAEVPHHEQWRTFTVSACAFPQTMGGIERHSHTLVERTDWIAWRDHLHAKRGALQRLPTFSDCAIQHPLGVEGFDPRIMQVSAAIRYTLQDEWLLIKGESTRSTTPSTQFPELATRLVYGHLRPYVCGTYTLRGL